MTDQISSNIQYQQSFQHSPFRPLNHWELVRSHVDIKRNQPKPIRHLQKHSDGNLFQFTTLSFQIMHLMDISSEKWGHNFSSGLVVPTVVSSIPVNQHTRASVIQLNLMVPNSPSVSPIIEFLHDVMTIKHYWIDVPLWGELPRNYWPFVRGTTT